MRLLYFCTFTALIIFSVSCSKKKDEEKICGTSYGESPVVRWPSYFDPQWSPGGNLIAFNHVPVTGLITNNCGVPYFKTNSDSAGFYLIKKDGTGFTRVTDRPLQLPKWSPDGKWLAYQYLGEIMLMPFNGTSFDTTSRVKITNKRQSGMFAWSPNSDSLYFLNTGTVSATSAGRIFRIGIDGKGLTEIMEGSNDFFITNDRIYFTQVRDIFSIKKDGSDKQQHTSGNDYKHLPLVHNNTLYYANTGGIFWSLAPGIAPTKLEDAVHSYDVSSTGEIVYSNFLPNNDQANAQNGTLWIMNADGSNKRQLTRNNL